MEEKRLISGRRPVREALQAGTAVSRIIVQQGLRTKAIMEIVSAAQAKQIAVEYWPKNALDKRVAGNHQGVVAEVPPFRYTPFERLLATQREEPPFLVILDHLQDPHNVGAIVRTAYAAGCHGLVLPERRAAGMTPAAVRT
ncbi:MAG TPA: 23S rRNA (guanosine(2251)-2'-O)-methyltransferase RlmB, partial [Firmicutes bacterium]|nr:23S rRNA (guanosine(2251)-2'-O)-methyltransferase RlmB [Bacillota bacterium]